MPGIVYSNAKTKQLNDSGGTTGKTNLFSRLYIYFYFMCMTILEACMPGAHGGQSRSLNLWKWNGIADVCELPCEHWELSTDL